jgi:hypothetical protein
MRRQLVTGALVSAFCALCAISGCNIVGEDKPSACEQDEALCPASSRQATDIGCDCHCVAGYAGITPTREFDGEISACLPPTLNLHTASPEQRDTLSALSTTQFNQRAFKYCSDTVATYMSDLIEQQQRPRDLGAICVGPRIKCKCTTTGAQEQTSTCSAPCADKECDQDNCQPLLKVGGILDATGCQCSRVSSCGTVTPATGEPPVCLNRIAGILKKRTKRDAGAR